MAELVHAARAGDQSGWDALVARYLPLVSAVINRHRLIPADADDVNQTVWLRLVEHLDKIREPQALPGWLATTTRNECLRVLGLRKRSVPVDPQAPSALDLAVDEREVDEDVLREESRQALRDALLELPSGRRDLLLLLMEDPLVSYDEISRRLGIPIGSIGPTRARALDQLRNTNALRSFRTSAPALEVTR